MLSSLLDADIHDVCVADDTDFAQSCPLCDSDSFDVLGCLGMLHWVRCRCCGAEFHQDGDSESTFTQRGGISCLSS